ncbi:MAG: GAF domain-containing protein [Ignavibacteriales bacterium]
MPEGCVFVLAVHRDGKSLEFAYPPQLKGNVIPVDHKSIAGHAVISQRSYITNNFRDERGFVLFDWLMSKGNAKIQKMITYPIIFLDKVVAVLHITRRGSSFSEVGPDFHNGDVEKIQSILDDSLNLHVVKSA